MAKHYYTKEEEREFLLNEPKKIVAVKAILKSDKGNVLVVKPNYKRGWQFPGGGVDASEDPEDAMHRELKEEVNLEIHKSDLKLLGTVFRKDVESLVLIYEYSRVLNEQKPIDIQQSELDDYKFVEPSTLSSLLGKYYKEFLTVWF